MQVTAQAADATGRPMRCRPGGRPTARMRGSTGRRPRGHGTGWTSGSPAPPLPRRTAWIDHHGSCSSSRNRRPRAGHRGCRYERFCG